MSAFAVGNFLYLKGYFFKNKHTLLFLLNSKNSMLFQCLEDPEEETPLKLSQAWSSKYVLIISVAYRIKLLRTA